MTAIHKPLKRSVENIDRGRDAVLTLYPGGALGVRLKRHKREWFISVRAVYQMAVQHEIDRERAEKRAARGQKTLVRRGRVA